MKPTFTSRIIVLLTLLLCCKFTLVAQNTRHAPQADTVRVIQIIRGKSLREKTVDSVTSIQTIGGDVILKEGLTLFYCDSAIINKNTNILEAFGNVHINQNDSIHTYSQYLKYIGKERLAYLKKEVRLTDNKGNLYTQELEYDLKSSIGKYFNGGRVVNGKTVLTSTEGIYYADTKDVTFKKNVHLVDPKYDMRNDTLLYNTETQVTSWNTPTNIISKKGGDIYSANGTYDLKNGKAFFGYRSVIKDSTRTYVADNSAYDEITGIAQLEGNAVIKDSANGYSVLGRSIYLDKNSNSFLATGKPVLIFKGEGNDSTFVAGDTLFSGVEKRDSLGRKITEVKDTLKKNTVVNINDSSLAKVAVKDTLNLKAPVKNELLKDSGQAMALVKNSHWKDSTLPNKPDSVAVKKDSAAEKTLVHIQPGSDTTATAKTDSLLKEHSKMDSTAIAAIMHKDSSANKQLIQKKARRDRDAHIATNPGKPPVMQEDAREITPANDIKKEIISPEDTIYKIKTIHSSKDTAIRYFIAFHHVKIFNDSLQSVCDSLYYSSEDSIFRLFQNPLVFSNNSQIAGDTIYMFTKNKQPARLYVFENGIIINKANERMYNQVAGRTLNGYFKGGELDYMRAKGSPAESVYYPQDQDSAYIGMNRGKGDVIDVYFLNKEVNKVKFINDVDGTMFPIRQIPEDQKYLKNYKWQDKRRPKNKLELFE